MINYIAPHKSLTIKHLYTLASCVRQHPFLIVLPALILGAGALCKLMYDRSIALSNRAQSTLRELTEIRKELIRFDEKLIRFDEKLIRFDEKLIRVEEATKRSLRLCKSLQSMCAGLLAGDSLLDIEIGTASAEKIAKALENDATIQSLYLTADDISPKSIKEIIEALKNNTTLQTLDLTNCRLPEASIQDLKRLEEEKNNDYKTALKEADKEAFSLDLVYQRIRTNSVDINDGKIKSIGLGDLPPEMMCQLKNTVYKGHLLKYPTVMQELKKLKPKITSSTYKLTIML